MSKRAFLVLLSFQRWSAVSFGTKTKTRHPEFEKKFLKLSRLLSPKPMKHDMVLLGGTRLETATKTGCNKNDGAAKPEPSSGSDFRR